MPRPHLRFRVLALAAFALAGLALHSSAQTDDGSIVLEGDAGSVVFGSDPQSGSVSLARSSPSGLTVSGALNVESALTVNGLPVALKTNTTATQTQVDALDAKVTAAEANIADLEARGSVARSVRVYARLDVTDYDSVSANEYASFPISIECYVDNDDLAFGPFTIGGPQALCAGDEVRGEVDLSCTRLATNSALVSLRFTVRTFYDGTGCGTTTQVASTTSSSFMVGDGHSLFDAAVKVSAEAGGDEAVLANIRVFNTWA